jgi:hypothetical protein
MKLEIYLMLNTNIIKIFPEFEIINFEFQSF